MIKRREHVLVVDDEKVIRDLLAQIMTRAGYCVDQACDGAEALAKLESAAFDYVISDVQMPNMDGIALLKKIKSAQPNVLVLLITGQVGKLDAEQAVKAGADGFVAKPFKNTEIAHTLAELSSKRKFHQVSATQAQKPPAGN